MTSQALLAEVERRIARSTEVERRARFERETLRAARTMLAMGEDATVVLAQLMKKGLRLNGAAREGEDLSGPREGHARDESS